ncbi:hypothetical protein HDU87_001908 [Geranomyces variabilis]|uniref:Ima1 N-terminal domain-containing protein n=1 Tax=Geranomyces variabilis TaxID=109894 RepID=A0AAD5XN62_9FUNG|nr:hypothetical protein HDU87_001908 [Geranomyces variabilis]
MQSQRLPCCRPPTPWQPWLSGLPPNYSSGSFHARAIKDIIDGTTTQPCFFCNEAVTLTKEELAITGGRSWRCTFCGQWNGEDELDKPGLGTPGVRYTQRQQPQQQQPQQHWPQQQQPDSLASYKNTLFCATCVQNQNLVVRLVAAYDPGDEEYYEMTIDEHKAQLEERYPPLCRECAVGVRVALTNETNMIERRLLLERLVRSSTSSWDEEDEDAATRGRFVKQTVTWWRVLADLWLVAAIAVMLAAHVRGIMYPLSFNAAFCEDPPYEATPPSQTPPSPPNFRRFLESLSSPACLAVPPRHEEENVDCVCALLPTLRWLNLLAAPGAVLHPLFLPLFGVDGDLRAYKTLQVKLFALRVLALYILADAWDPQALAAVHACCLILCAAWTRQWAQHLQWAKPIFKLANPNSASASPPPPSLEQTFAAMSGNSRSDTLGIEHAFQRSASLADKSSDARLAQFRAKRAFHRRLLANLRSVGIPAVGVLALWTHINPTAPRVGMAFTAALGVAWAIAFACHQDEIARKVTLLYAALSLRLVVNISAWLLMYHRTEPDDLHVASSADNAPASCLPSELGAVLPEWVDAIAAPVVVATLVDLVGAITLFVCAPT